MEVLLDEVVRTKEDVLALGILPGDIVCFEPRTVVTPSGFIKSRFLDDKLSTGVLLGYAKYLKDENITPARRIYHHITVFEEVGARRLRFHSAGCNGGSFRGYGLRGRRTGL